MASCKECVHCEACKSQVPRTSWDSEIFYDGCKYFKDKSKSIELPCNVGDTVYYFCETFGVILPYFIESISIAYLDKNKPIYQYEANATNIKEDELLDSIDFEPDDIGKTVFFTYEEAEKKLKEFKDD